MDEIPLWHRGFHQPFRHKPPVGPESVRERGETFGITLDGEEVDTCRAPIWDVTDSKTQISHEAMLDEGEGGSIRRTMVRSSSRGKDQDVTRPSENRLAREERGGVLH